MGQQLTGKYRRREDDDSSRSPTRRRLSYTKPPRFHNSSSPAPAQSQSSSPSSTSSTPSPDPYPILYDSSSTEEGSPLYREKMQHPPPLSHEVVRAFREKGAAYQTWIANPAEIGCAVLRSTDTIAALLNNNEREKRFKCRESQYTRPPDALCQDLEKVGLPTTKTYRFTQLSQVGYDEQGHKRQTQYTHSSTEGAFIAEAIVRYTGPNWSNIALAQYRFDHDIDTLRYVYFVNVVNDETMIYVRDVLYQKYQLLWVDHGRAGSHIWKYGTPDYQEILGTKLGKAVACLVLGAWERGTHRIARVCTEVEDDMLNMRFDIESISTSPSA
ncbi:hypothetical protein N7475_001069 [Penicillium sp. IBT 31633x]|nr:hypothetical protein N7475_001069 [Penicillium sp. IBT 31633x]